MLLTTILGLMIVGALIALESRSLLAAIISIGSVGFLAAIAFVLLGAPDVAFAQITVVAFGSSARQSDIGVVSFRTASHS